MTTIDASTRSTRSPLCLLARLGFVRRRFARRRDEALDRDLLGGDAEIEQRGLDEVHEGTATVAGHVVQLGQWQGGRQPVPWTRSATNVERNTPMARFFTTCAVAGFVGMALAAAPPKPVQPRFTFIDLRSQANQKLTDRFGRIQGNNFGIFANRRTDFADVKFKVADGVLLLDSPNLTVHKVAKFERIAVGQTARKLHFLHGTIFGNSNPAISDDTTIAEYTIRYDHGSTATIPVVYGKDLCDWSSPEEARTVRRGKVAWTGENDESKRLERHLYLYLCTWENPKPEKRIATIDFRKSGTSPAAPFCVAITAEK